MSLLKVSNATLRFGGVKATDSLSFTVDNRAICSIIGPNGAGKTSIFNCISGVFYPSEGQIYFDGKNLKECFSTLILAKVLCMALPIACVAPFIYYAETLWQKTITEKYIFNTKFSWLEALHTLYATFLDLPWLTPFFITWILVTLALLANWSRSRVSPFSISQRGIARTFQNIRLFKSMSTLENVLVGMSQHFNTNLLECIFHTKKFLKNEQSFTDNAFAILKFVGLENHIHAKAQDLAYGLQRRLEIARALALKPKLILLDEPAAGMNPSELNQLLKLISAIREQGITVLLIEHHMKLVMQISEKIIVLDHGIKIAEGTADEVKNNPQTIKAYLGIETENSHAH